MKIHHVKWWLHLIRKTNVSSSGQSRSRCTPTIFWPIMLNTLKSCRNTQNVVCTSLQSMKRAEKNSQKCDNKRDCMTHHQAAACGCDRVPYRLYIYDWLVKTATAKQTEKVEEDVSTTEVEQEIQLVCKGEIDSGIARSVRDEGGGTAWEGLGRSLHRSWIKIVWTSSTLFGPTKMFVKLLTSILWWKVAYSEVWFMSPAWTQLHAKLLRGGAGALWITAIKSLIHNGIYALSYIILADIISVATLLSHVYTVD